MKNKYDEHGYEKSIDPKYLTRHREVYIESYGAPPTGYHIHHIDHNKLNNSLDNLIAIPAVIHEYVHYISKKNGHILTRDQIENELVLYFSKIEELKQNRVKLQKLKEKIDLIENEITILTKQEKYWKTPEGLGFLSGDKRNKLRKKRSGKNRVVILTEGLMSCEKCKKGMTEVVSYRRRKKQFYQINCRDCFFCRNIKKKTIPLTLIEKLQKGHENE